MYCTSLPSIFVGVCEISILVLHTTTFCLSALPSSTPSVQRNFEKSKKSNLDPDPYWPPTSSSGSGSGSGSVKNEYGSTTLQTTQALNISTLRFFRFQFVGLQVFIKSTFIMKCLNLYPVSLLSGHNVIDCVLVFRLTPFQYYIMVLENIMSQEKSYDSLPNFTAVDCLRWNKLTNDKRKRENKLFRVAAKIWFF